MFLRPKDQVLTDGMTRELGHPERTSSHTLNQYPVEVLAIEEPSRAHEYMERYWAQWLDACKPIHLPHYVIVSTTASELVEANGLQSKP
jgi:hypothetical protein